MITPCGQILVSRKLAIRDERNIRLRCSTNVKKSLVLPIKNARSCPENDPTPCVRSKRPHVYRHHAHMLKDVCAWFRYIRGRFERTHGGVLNRHTAPHTTPHTHTHREHTHTHTHHTTRQQHDYNTTRRQRQREDRERRQRQREKRRRKRRRQDKRREKIHFQCGGAWPFLVDGVFLVNPVCARFLSLLNSVKYDSI